MSQRMKIIIAAGLVGVVVIVAIVIASIFNRPPSTGVEFIVAPDDIVVEGGDRRVVVDYESVVAFSPGTYELILSREHFETAYTTIEVKDGEVTPLYLAMEPSDEQGRLILQATNMRFRLERIAGFQVSSGAEEISNEYSFVDKLPITGKFFTINPCILEESSDDSIGICIDLPIDKPFYRTQALDALKAADIDVTKWTIVYNNAVQQD